MNAIPLVAGTSARRFYVTAVVALGSMASSAWADSAPTDSSPVKAHLIVTDLMLENLNTGPRPHTFANAGAIFAGADFDMSKLMGLPGGTFQFEYTFFPWMRNEGQPTAGAWQGATGSALGGAPMHNDIDKGYLSKFEYRQMLLDNHLELDVGRSNAKQHFYMMNCENWVTCNDPIIENTTGILPYPYGSWGGYSRYSFDNGQYIHAGAFESNPAHYIKRTKGWNWDPGDASGITWLAGVGAQKSFAQTPLAYHYELNGFYNTSEQTDILDGSTRRGSSGLIYRFMQTLSREGGSSAGNPDKAWQVFGAWTWSADDLQPFEHFVEAGITRVGPFGRPQDSVSLKASYLRLGDKQVQYQHDQRLLATGVDQGMSKGESRVELNMVWQATPYLALQPSVQYVFNPSNFYNPQAEVSSDGAVVGLQIVYNLGAQLGL
ncbi:porin [Pseudomonas sp. PvR086]|jgi:porin|uniref:carbohydrate porin n=1 Tax=Pseudomonas TaxID=286 RepID=UPI0017874B48|nr:MULTISPECIES: carbohydrate porin [Pseudomonas]MBD9604356.1 carbohydrate porin [Pseudomonas sp. PDM08]MDR7104722.1 porin [Pseudomonas frederiksbergensis]